MISKSSHCSPAAIASKKYDYPVKNKRAARGYSISRFRLPSNLARKFFGLKFPESGLSSNKIDPATFRPRSGSFTDLLRNYHQCLDLLQTYPNGDRVWMASITAMPALLTRPANFSPLRAPPTWATAASTALRSVMPKISGTKLLPSSATTAFASLGLRTEPKTRNPRKT